MSFVLDQQTVFDEANAVISDEISDQIRPHISGGHAALHRYSVASEKTGISLGAYVPGSDNTYSWPGRHVGSLIDLSYVRLWIDNALLRFFSDPKGSLGTVAAPGGSLNKLTTTAAGFKTATGFPRNTALKDRDVKRGDVVKIWDTDVSQAFWTYVADLIPDTVAAVRGSATSDAGNASTQSASTTPTQTAGGLNRVDIAADGTAYTGLASGDISETYTVTCTTGGVAAAARLDVHSASGRDDVANVTPSAFASPTNIGTRGLTATFSLDSGRPTDSGLPTSEFVAGQTWQIVVHQAFTAPTIASGGTYTGTELNTSLTYTITVVSGGTTGGGTAPTITATRNDGADSSGPTQVPTSGVAVAVGTKGLTITFTATKLRKGDVYYIPVTSQSYGAYKTILLGQNMPSALAGASDLNLKLYIRKNIEVPNVTAGNSPTVNWTVDQSGITVQDSLQGYDASLTDNGTAFAAPIEVDASTLMYVQYREWLTTYADTVASIIVASVKDADIQAAVVARLGTIHPDNPLSYGVYKALLNSNGTKVCFTAVTDPSDVESWGEIPPILEGIKDIYSLVPLTDDTEVHQLWIDHCIARSNDSIGGEWRSCWLPLTAVASVPLVDPDTPTSEGDPLLGTLTANTAVSGNPITLFTCTSGNGKFVTNGVQAGDVLRFLYQVNAVGEYVHQEFPVASVTNEDVLILATPNGSAVSVAQTFEIWRNQSRTQMVTAMRNKIQASANKRVRYVWPDEVGDAGLTAGGYHLCAALAGFVGGIAPHQSIRNVTFKGFDDVTGSSVAFNNGQLNVLIAAGCVVVLKDLSGVIYASYARTTDPSSADNFEEMVVRNDDAFSHFLYRRCQSFLGQTNVTDTGLAMIKAGVTAAISTAKGGTLIDRIGTMITDGKVQELKPHETQEDRVVLTVSRKRPYPANEATITLVM